MSYLIHHGILGQKWGVRRFQNEDGSLTPAGEKRYGKQIRKKERAYSKNGYGSNYEKVKSDFKNSVLNDKKYVSLSKKARDLEYKRMMMEKEEYDKDSENYWDKLPEKYFDLDRESRKALEEKERYAQELSDKFVDRFKEAVLDDLNITQNREIAKKFLKERGSTIWDMNLEWNPDNYYDPYDGTRLDKWDKKNISFW